MSETMSEMFLTSYKSEVIFLTSDETLMVGTLVLVGHGKRTCEIPFICRWPRLDLSNRDTI